MASKTKLVEELYFIFRCFLIALAATRTAFASLCAITILVRTAAGHRLDFD